MEKTPMPLSFDIETEGLNSSVDRITVASIYDPDRGRKKTFFFTRSEEELQASVRDFLQELDDADILYCFNGIRFDLPFIIKRFDVPEHRFRHWFLKVFDLFEVCKCVFDSSCSLNKVLETNGQDVKCSDGRQACIWAAEGEWEKLENYCMQDTVLTHVISTQGRVVLPLTNKRAVCCVSRLEASKPRKMIFHY